MKIFFKTYGCRVNQYETEGLREMLLADGVSRAVRDFKDADVCVVNTCTVTSVADRDARQIIRRITRRNPVARLIVTGCFATRAAKEIREIAPEAVIVDNKNKDDIPSLIGCRTAPDEAGIQNFADHSRAFVKVQDGCNMYCTYCIVPLVRPRMESRPIEKLEREVRRLVKNGYSEIVLCGIRLGRYLTNDKAGKRVDFVRMLERLTALPGDFRIRLSSLEITDITERFLALVEESDGKICPSFHLPLQSGSDNVLRKMRRWYSTEFYSRRIEALKNKLPDAGLFTDLMVGFPGETKEDFKDTVRFIEKTGFSGLHVFRYSKRAGTPAAVYKGQVPDDEIMRRANRMRAVDKRLRTSFAASAMGSRRRVLVEEKGDGVEGLTDHFLRVQIDKNPGPGLHWARIVADNHAVTEKGLPERARSDTFAVDRLSTA